MRILQISLGDGYAGSARFAILSSWALKKRGHHVGLVVTKGSLTEKRGRQLGLEMLSLVSLAGGASFQDFEQRVQSWRPDVAVGHHSPERKLLMRMRRRKSASFLAVAFRNIVSRSFPLVSAIPSNLWLDGVIACSHGVARSLMLRGIWPGKIHVVHNGIEVPKKMPRARNLSSFGVRKNEAVIGMCAWFHPRRKGFDTVFRGLSKGLDRPFRLLLMGVVPQHEKPCLQMARSMGFDPRLIIFPGYVDDVWAYYRAMDVFILPSREEGFSLSLLEAMAAERPCVASAIPGNDEAIRDGSDGFLFPRGRPEGLRSSIQRVLSSPDKKRFMGKQARKRVLSSFTIAHAAEGLEKVFNELGKKNG